MLDHSIEELREFVNNYRLNNNDEAHASNGTTRQYSNDELIQLLESDTLNMEDKEEAEKTAGNNSESQDDFHVLKVKENGIKGLTVEVRENLFSKFNTALSINYKTIFNNQKTTLTDANICDIAKKIEFSILSLATDLNSYKLSGAEKVVNIEKQTCNRNLCEALRAEIELLKLRDHIRTSHSKDNPQQPSNVLTLEAETISHKKSPCQDNQSNTDIAVNSPLPTLGILKSETEEYFSCSSGDHGPTEIQQNNESCTSKSNTQNPVVCVPEEKTSKETEPTDVKNCQIVSTTKIFHECNNNCSEKNTTETNNVLSEIHSNNGTDNSDLASTEGVARNKKRKRKSKSDEESAIQDNKENTNLTNHAADTRMANNPPDKKYKITISDEITDTPDSTTTDELTPPFVCVPFFEGVESEPGDIKSERFSPPPNKTECISHSQETVCLGNSLSTEIPDEKYDSLDCNEKEFSSDEKVELQAEVIKSEVISHDQNVDVIVRCRITSQTEISSKSDLLHSKENFDMQMDNIVIKNENASSVDVDSSNILNDNTVLQNPELNSENDALSSSGSSTCSGLDTEMIAAGGSNSSAVDANNDHQEINVVVEKTYLVDEEAFELERARLDRLYEEIKKRTEESDNHDFIDDDHQHIFEIIIPIIKEYYPSDYIPEQWSYDKILQRLQDDLAEAKMSDEEMVTYTRDSIKTMRYLCDHCIVQ